MVKAKRMVTVWPFLAMALVTLPAFPQGVTSGSSPRLINVATSVEGATAAYQCFVTTRDGGVEKIVVQAASEDAARTASAMSVGSRSIGFMGVSCGHATGSEPSLQRTEVKTRAPAPSLSEPISPEVEFGPDGSCRLSLQAIVAHPDARDHCQGHATSTGAAFACPATYCGTLKLR
jgi:hypothetical protein